MEVGRVELPSREVESQTSTIMSRGSGSRPGICIASARHPGPACLSRGVPQASDAPEPDLDSALPNSHGQTARGTWLQLGSHCQLMVSRYYFDRFFTKPPCQLRIAACN